MFSYFNFIFLRHGALLCHPAGMQWCYYSSLQPWTPEQCACFSLLNGWGYRPTSLTDWFKKKNWDGTLLCCPGWFQTPSLKRSLKLSSCLRLQVAWIMGMNHCSSPEELFLMAYSPSRWILDYPHSNGAQKKMDVSKLCSSPTSNLSTSFDLLSQHT